MRAIPSSVKATRRPRIRNKRNHGHVEPMYRDDFPLNFIFSFSLTNTHTLSLFPCLLIYSINARRLATRQCFYALNHRGHAPRSE